ncbi:ATP-binding protein [Streptantibioticus rubrisoli]|uniref:ATP-binding protein n=1 Tax=Streptantibioticus rubrisoli TaxID=1387313 RepID=A0ABT1P9M1_9ACTN|nr:ATP-binding protein [Streptantibioticus rubrisoli]MCQ4042067.1 ATP-binding protein [Streptantibioticus rubrisoli]
MTLESPPIVTTSGLCRLQLRAEPAQFGAVRRIVSAYLRLWGRTGLIDSAVVCVTEILANVHRHVNPSECELVLENMPEGVRAAVRDQSSVLPVVVEGENWLGESGRGMFIVANTADLWGTSPVEGGGKQVWVLLREGA